MITVKATREGLVAKRTNNPDGTVTITGRPTSSGYLIDTVVPFVALPDGKALDRFVRVTNPANGRSAIAWVGETGPWNEHDDAYVFGGARPAAETGVDTRGRKTNGAGIDLSEKIYRQLGLIDNSPVEWEFV